MTYDKNQMSSKTTVRVTIKFFKDADVIVGDAKGMKYEDIAKEAVESMVWSEASPSIEDITIEEIDTGPKIDDEKKLGESEEG